MKAPPHLRGRLLAVLAILVLAAAPPAAGQPAHLSVTVLDAEGGRPTPVRARLTQAGAAAAPLPPEAVGVMYGHWDHADGFAYLPDSAFYTRGTFALDLASGTYHLELTKGPEYLAQTHALTLAPADTLRRTFRLERWADMPARGWFSSDAHIHVRRSPREDSLLMAWTQAEDVHVGVFLRMGDFWATYYAQHGWGEDGVYREGDYLLAAGQEDPRTPELGHTLGLGADAFVRDRDRYYLYDEVFDRLRALGGVAGYAHQGATFHGERGLALDGLRGKVDVLELLQFCAPGGPLITDHYYHLLDLGFRITAVAGSDFPWCGQDHRYGFDVAFDRAARIGNARFYVHTGDTLSYAHWRDALGAGRTFVSSGPMLELAAAGAGPGATVDAQPGDTVLVTARALGHAQQTPLDRLELVGHGRMLATATAGGAGQTTERLEIELALPVERGLWVAARAWAGPMQVAHTTPVYVTVDGTFHNPATAAHYLDLSERYLQELEAELDRQQADRPDSPERQAWRYREALQRRIEETRRVIERLRRR